MNKIKVLILLIVVLILGCKSHKLSDKTLDCKLTSREVSESKSKLFNDKTNGLREKAYKKFFSDSKNNHSDGLIIIELFFHRYSDFDNLIAEIYFYEGGNKINKFIIEGGKLLFNEELISNEETIEIILDLIKNQEFKQLKHMHKNINYSLSQPGVVYVSILDADLQIIRCLKFEEFMYSKDTIF